MNHLPGLSEAVGDFEITRVQTKQALAALRPEWNELWERCTAALPFQAPEWLLPWWQCYGSGELCVICIRRNGCLVVLAPFYLDRSSDQLQLTIVGNGVTDRLDVLVDPDISNDGMLLLGKYLTQQRTWTSCDFRDLSGHSALLTLELDHSRVDRFEREAPSPALSLPRSPQELAERASHKLQVNLRQCHRRAERLGPVEFVTADQQNLSELFAALLKLHAARWRQRGEGGVLSTAEAAAFHREVVLGFLNRGWLRFYALKIGSKIAAVQYGFTVRRRSYFYLGGFDPAMAKISPGKLLLEHALHAAIAEGATALDFLRGGESYKYEWGATDTPQYRRRVWFEP